jgi:hypothetical protein
VSVWACIIISLFCDTIEMKIYQHRERERERERQCACTYIYICIHEKQQIKNEVKVEDHQ